MAGSHAVRHPLHHGHHLAGRPQALRVEALSHERMVAHEKDVTG